jgi:hypothetical protein
MRERRLEDESGSVVWGTNMQNARIAIGAVMAIAGLVLSGAASATPIPVRSGAGTQAGAATELSAQARARPRIRVRPRSWSTPPIYPSPAPYNYPGPNAVRECKAWLAVEHRPSGTVLVPRERCWWAFPR